MTARAVSADVAAPPHATQLTAAQGTLAHRAVTHRAVTPADVADITALYSAVFDRDIDDARYLWKMAGPSTSAAAPAAWLTADPRVVAHYGASPLRVRLRGAEHPALHGCDIMCAPDHRGRGITAALGTAAHAAWTEQGSAFVLGLPTDAWGGLRQRLGCRTAFPLGWLWRPLRASALLPHRVRARRTIGAASAEAAALAADTRPAALGAHWLRALARTARGVDVTRVAGAPGRELDVMQQQLASSYDVMVVRDRAWLTHRFDPASGVDYVLHVAWRGGVPVGCCAHRIVHGARVSGWIVDLFTAPADDAARAALLHASVSDLARDGVDDVRVFAAPGSALYGGLRRAGFIPRPGGYDMVVIPLAQSLPDSVLHDPARWFVGGSDFDVI